MLLDSPLRSLLFIIHTHLLGCPVHSHSDTDHLHAEDFDDCTSSPHTSPQLAIPNVILTIYTSIWMCNGHLLFPMPKYKLSSLPPQNRDKNNLLLLYFSSFQFLVTSFFRFLPNPWVIFLSFHLTPQIWSVSKSCTSTFRLYKESNTFTVLTATTPICTTILSLLIFCNSLLNETFVQLQSISKHQPMWFH